MQVYVYSLKLFPDFELETDERAWPNYLRKERVAELPDGLVKEYTEAREAYMALRAQVGQEFFGDWDPDA